MLRERVPEVSARSPSAEDIPANDRSVDVVVVAQAFHWFDHERALPEIARVLKPGGHVALVWNSATSGSRGCAAWCGWSATQDVELRARATSCDHELFGFVEEATFTHWQDVDRETLRRPRRVALQLRHARRGGARGQARRRCGPLRRLRPRQRRHAAALRHQCYRGEGRDLRDGLPRARRAERRGPVVSDGTDTDMLLIDFR